MTDVDQVVAGLLLMNVIIALAVQLAVVSAAYVIHKRAHARQIATRFVPPPPPACNQIIASGWVDGNLHTANCCLPKGHHSDHATFLTALLFIGFQQPPF